MPDLGLRQRPTLLLTFRVRMKWYKKLIQNERANMALNYWRTH